MRPDAKTKGIIRATAIVALLVTIPLLDYSHVSHNAGGAIVATEVLFAWFLDTFSKSLSKAWFWGVALLLFSSHCVLLWVLLERILPRSSSIGNLGWAALLVPEAILFLFVTLYVKSEARKQALSRRKIGQ
jgi:hypothetical protein